MLQVGKQDRVINTSFRFYGKFYAEKYSKVFLWNVWNVLTRILRRKHIQILYTTGRGDQIATSAKLLDNMDDSNGFNADLIEAIN